MKIIVLAACAALVACSAEPTATADDSVGEGPAPATAAAEHTGPSGAYRPFFEERWPANGAQVTPAEVVAMIESQGESAAVNALWSSGESDQPTRFDTAMRGIATGDPAWLAVALRIAPGLDASASDSFAMAIQDALTTNAAGSLRLMSQLANFQAGCTHQSFEPATGQVRAFYITAIAAVEAVSDPALARLKATCLSQLKSGLATNIDRR